MNIINLMDLMECYDMHLAECLKIFFAFYQLKCDDFTIKVRYVY